MIFPNEIISIGYSNSKIVPLIKSRLNNLGFGPLDVNIHNIGSITTAAIMKFQKSKNLIADGEVGELTWDRLFNNLNPRYPNSLSSKVIYIAKDYLGIREKTGKNDGPEVERFQLLTGNSRGDAWCMSFVYGVFLEASQLLRRETPVPKTGSVMECLRLSTLKGYAIKYKDPLPGDQGIMSFGGGKGHTFIVTDVKSDRVFTIEGNTSADPKYIGEDREGNGVFERNRPISTIKCFIRYI